MQYRHVKRMLHRSVHGIVSAAIRTNAACLANLKHFGSVVATSENAARKKKRPPRLRKGAAARYLDGGTRVNTINKHAAAAGFTARYAGPFLF